MIYEYKCSECEEIWEEILPLSKYDKPMKNKCPHCDAKKGSVYRHIGTAPAMKMDSNFKIDQPHNEGGFQDAMKKVVEAPGVKGTAAAKRLKERHIG